MTQKEQICNKAVELLAKEPQGLRFAELMRRPKHEPDMFYANRNLKVVEDELFG